MKNIEIKVSKTSRMVYLKNGNIGNDGENLQEKLVFSFQDKFVDGQARLEYEIDGEKYFAILTKVGERYELPIKNVITKEGQVNMQLVITEGTDENEIPVFKSNVFYVFVNKSINAESEEPDGYAQWLDIANTKLNSIDEAVSGVQEAIDYAKEQGDYAKEQAENVISANEEASEIIRDFEDDVEEYTSAFNENATNKTTDYNTNATNKVTEYNDNATEKLNAYNTNANNKVGEYNVNADNRINDFNQNADSYLDAIVPKNEASGVPIYVDDALGYRVLNLSAKGNYEQETTTGKNLFNPNNVERENNSTLEITSTGFNVTRTHSSGYGDEFVASYTTENLQPNTTYTFNLNVESENTFTNNSIFVYSDSLFGTTLTKTNYEENGNNRKWNITTDGNGKIVIGFYGKTTTQNIPFNFTNIQLELGTTATDFEKFTNGASPNPDFPSEIEVLEGYNLFDKDSVITGKVPSISNGQLVDSVNGATTDYIQIDNSLNYILSYALNGSGSVYILFYGENYSYIGNNIINASNYNLSTSSYYSNAKYIRIRFDTYVNFNDIQLVKGTQKPYLPYNNLGYMSVGKNLLRFPYDEMSAKYAGVDVIVNDDGSLLFNGTGTGTEYIDIVSPQKPLHLKAGTYTVSLKNIGIEFTIKGKENLCYISKNQSSKSFTITEDTDVTAFFSVRSDTTYNVTMYPQLELGNVATDYEPFQETITPIDLKGNFVGELPNGVADNLLYKDRHIYLEKNVGEYNVNIDDIQLATSSNAGYTNIDYVVFPKPSDAYSYGNFKDEKNICTHLMYTNYVANTGNFDSEKNINCLNSVAARNNYWAGFPKGITLEEVKEKLDGCIVYYPLATPELIDLGEYDLSTLQGTNNISLLANLEPSEMNITYALDLKKYIDKKVQ